MIINAIFDQLDASLPAGFKAGVNAVIQFLEANFADPITINIAVGYGEIAGQAISSGALGQSNSIEVRLSNYTQMRNLLAADATTSDDASSVANLPSIDPTGGGPFYLTRPEAKALGVIGASGAIDGYVGFSSTAAFDYDISNGVSAGTYDFMAVVAHELSEVMGRIFGDASFLPLDLFHYASPGHIQLFGTQPGYFSIDGGVTNLRSFNTDPNADFSDWASNAGNDPFRAYAVSGIVMPVSDADLAVLDAIGYDRVSASIVASAAPFDFNGDGDGDLLWQESDGTPAVWILSGTSFVSGGIPRGSPGADWHVKGSGDFNADGKADILWQSDDGTPAVWLMNGTSFNSGGVPQSSPGTNWHIKGAGDFDGDGKADILWQLDDGSVAIWLMNGTTFVSQGIPRGSPGTDWHVIAAADFNGDGKADILWQNDDGTAAVWLMNGTSFVSGGVPRGSPGTDWHVKGAGDFNGDGKADILWQNDDGTAAIWLMNGVNFVSGGIPRGSPGTDWHVKGAEDTNGDGKADIIWQNTDGTPAVWLMNGTSFVSGGIPHGSPGSSWHIVAAGG